MTKEQLASVLEAHVDRYQLRASQAKTIGAGVAGIGDVIRVELYEELMLMLRMVANDLRRLE